MEKRRRARINNCLNELKSILLEAMRKDPARHSKLEKADILELTVSHLKALHRQSQSSVDNSRFRAGFAECASEVNRFLATASKTEPMDTETNHRLLNHLAECLKGPMPGGTTNVATTPMVPDSFSPQSHQGSQSLNVPTNTPIISLVPSRLANGEIAFVVPGFNSNGLRQPMQMQVSSMGSSNNPSRPMLSPDVPLELTVSSSGSPKCSISPMYAHPGLPIHAGYMQSASVHRTTTTVPMGMHSQPGFGSSPMFHAPTKSGYSDDNNNNGAHMNAQPLSLVTPKKEILDDNCWRPW